MKKVLKAEIVRELEKAGFKPSLKKSTEEYYSNGNPADDIIVPMVAELEDWLVEQIRGEIQAAKKRAQKK